MNRKLCLVLMVSTCTSACMSGCTKTEAEKIHDFVPGTYVYSHFDNRAMHFDTLTFKQSDTDNSRIFEVNHSWSDISGIKPYKEIHSCDLSTAEYDTFSKSIRVRLGNDTVRVFFKPAFGEALIEGRHFAEKIY